MEEVEIEEENEQIIKVLELFKQASKEIQSDPVRSICDRSAAINALLELQTESDTLLSDPCLSQLSNHLSYLKTLVLQNTGDGRGGGGGLRSFLCRRVWIHQIARVAESIEWELQAWIDREVVESLVRRADDDDDQLRTLLSRFQDRVSQGFNRELQDLLLKSRVFSELESILTNPAYSVSLREQAAFAIDSLIGFNKNVFVGQVLMGPTTKALITIGSASSLKVLCSLIRSIKSPLVDEIEGEDQIGAIIGYMSSSQETETETERQAIAVECVMEIGYYGRKEAVEAMIKAQVVEKLLEVERSGSCVGRFAVQVEVGEGLRQREKRFFKQEILKRVRDAAFLTHAQAATIQSQVLWGASFL